jgi:hypothetical protein
VRKRWIQDKKTGKLIPADEYTARSERKGPAVHGDIQPYRAITGDMQGKWITSRSKHREFLRRNDLVEVGNEKDYFTRYGGKSPDNPALQSERKHEEQVCRSLVKNLERLKSR